MGQPASPFTDADRLIEILRSNEILNEKQQAAIKKILSSGKLATESPRTLDDVLTALDQKVQKDLERLNAVVIDLSNLYENRYARRTANLKSYDLEVCINFKQKLMLAVSKSDGLLTKYRVAMTAEDYLAGVERKSRFLFDEPDSATIPAMWKLIK